MTNRGSEPAEACYCLRRANPFLGVVAVVETASGRALSADGRTWQIEVFAAAPAGPWSPYAHHDSPRYFRFGVWTHERGLRRVHFNPMFDGGGMHRVADDLVERVDRHRQRLPFPLAPEDEWWQLDRAGRPIALLATAHAGADLTRFAPHPFAAGDCVERPFVATRSAPGVGQDCRRVEQMVKRASGRFLNRRWFRREPSGQVSALAAATDSSELPARVPAELPVLPLATHWEDPADRDLAADYLDWLSPYLLALPALDDTLRARFEQHALRYPLLVDALWRLYPRVLDEGFLTRARVEAKLRRAHS